MNLTVKNISAVIDEEYKDYAMYVLENRAIPSYVDGLKPTSRKILYSMLKHFKGKKTKVAELGSSITSVANYHHGEASAMGAVVTLTASWNNNVPLFRSYGNFGSRLINEAAAPRYIFCDLNPDFYKYFADFSVCEKNSDLDNPEPQQYLPIIPWILVNGIEGIAVGFACKYMPHDPKDIAKACLKAVNGSLNYDEQIPVTLPGFKGTILQDGPDRIITRGLVEKSGKNKWTITEVPWGNDREKFFNSLDKMMENGKIVEFEDNCDNTGFNFTIKLDQTQNKECESDPIAYFKLEKPFTENYTALDEDGKLILFNNKNEIIERFVKFRIKKVEDRLAKDISELSSEILFLEAKSKFILDVIHGNIDFLKTKKSDLIEHCTLSYSVEKESAEKIVSTPIYNMTTDAVKDLNSKISSLIKERKVLEKSNAKDVYINMLNEIIN